MRYVGLALALLRLALAERFLATVFWGDRRLAEGELQVRGCGSRGMDMGMDQYLLIPFLVG